LSIGADLHAAAELQVDDDDLVAAQDHGVAGALGAFLAGDVAIGRAARRTARRRPW
jgi:hypothetical protein